MGGGVAVVVVEVEVGADDAIVVVALVSSSTIMVGFGAGEPSSFRRFSSSSIFIFSHLHLRGGFVESQYFK